MTELEGEAPGAISLLGVNAAGEESGNEQAVSGAILPLLQDTPETHAWSSWQVSYRDVVVLDARNEVRSVLNLTEHDLKKPENYAALKRLLLEAR
ncbi:MAG: hypothetical protein ACYC8T_05805 [Myxococcaceae bacterium]